VVVGKKADGKNQYLTDILKMNADELKNLASYKEFPNKEMPYEEK